MSKTVEQRLADEREWQIRMQKYFEGIAKEQETRIETERRAACYDELLDTAVDAEAYITGGYDDGRLPPYRAPVILRLRAAISKAKPPTD